MKNATTAIAPTIAKLRGLNSSQLITLFSFGLDRGGFASGFCREANGNNCDNGDNADGDEVHDIKLDHFRIPS